MDIPSSWDGRWSGEMAIASRNQRLLNGDFAKTDSLYNRIGSTERIELSLGTLDVGRDGRGSDGKKRGNLFIGFPNCDPLHDFALTRS